MKLITPLTENAREGKVVMSVDGAAPVSEAWVVKGEGVEVGLRPEDGGVIGL